LFIQFRIAFGMLAWNNIVFESSSTVDVKSRYAVFSVQSDGWLDQHAHAISDLKPEDTLILAESNLKDLTVVAEDTLSWNRRALETGTVIDGALMYKAIAVLRITTTTGKVKSAAVVLVPRNDGDLGMAKVVLMPMKLVEGYVEGNTRYKALRKHEYDERLGKPLFQGCKVCFFRVGCILRTPHSHNLQGKRRAQQWRQAMGDVGPTGGNRYLANRRPAPQNVRLALPVVSHFCQKLEEGDQLKMKVRYGGGKMHAPLRLPVEARSLKESLEAQYRVVPRPVADYTICVENHATATPVRYFERPLRAEDIVSAVRSLREEAEAALKTDDLEEMLGAVASCLYEDVGWKLDAVSPVQGAAISELTVDVDQVSDEVQPYLHRNRFDKFRLI
jgi:hypothetical protein